MHLLKEYDFLSSCDFIQPSLLWASFHRFFSTRAIAMFLDVIIISFNWTVIVVTLLHVRGWFPFKVNKVRCGISRGEKPINLYTSY